MPFKSHLPWLFLLCCGMLAACEEPYHGEPGPDIKKNYPDYAMLKVGNYWIYERYQVDSLGNRTPLGIFDSCFVEKDTLIHGNRFFKMVRPQSNWAVLDISYQRDSLHYVVDATGKALFSSEDFGSRFENYFITGTSSDTVCWVVRQMDPPLHAEVCDAGIFKTLDSKLTFYFYPSWQVQGAKRYMHTRYAKNTGIVVENFPFYVLQPGYTERRLVRYRAK